MTDDVHPRPHTVWVSGAGSGMGRASAVALAAPGTRVAVSGRRRDALDETAQLVRASGGEALVLPLDVTDRTAIAEAAARIQTEWGDLTALVCSAGLNAPKRSWADQTMESFDAIVATNLGAVAAMIDATLPALRRTGGVVVAVSSYAGWRPSASSGVAYGASKTALRTLCATLNMQEGASGVRATHLCPGDTDTEFLQQRPQVPDADARAVMLSGADVARCVRFVLDSPPHVRIDELVVSPLSQRLA